GGGAEPAREVGEPQAGERGGLDVEREALIGARRGERRDGPGVRGALARPRREHADPAAAADRGAGRRGRDEAAHDEPIPGERAERRGGVEPELGERGPARLEPGGGRGGPGGGGARGWGGARPRGLHEDERGEDLRRAVVDEDLRAARERP